MKRLNLLKDEDKNIIVKLTIILKLFYISGAGEEIRGRK